MLTLAKDGVAVTPDKGVRGGRQGVWALQIGPVGASLGRPYNPEE